MTSGVESLLLSIQPSRDRDEEVLIGIHIQIATVIQAFQSIIEKTLSKKEMSATIAEINGIISGIPGIKKVVDKVNSSGLSVLKEQTAQKVEEFKEELEFIRETLEGGRAILRSEEYQQEKHLSLYIHDEKDPL